MLLELLTVVIVLHFCIPEELGKMNSNRCANESPHGLTDLPLNVIFRILSFLDLKQLQSIAKCCRLLRVLANENFFLTNTLMNLHSRRDQWTRRLIFDVFDIFNGSRHVILRLTTAYNISLLESIRIVQKNYGLGYSKWRSSPGTSYSKSLSKDVLEGSGEIQTSNIESGDAANCNTTFMENRNCIIEREAMTYMEILQGFHRLCASSQDDIIESKRVNEETWDDSEHEISLEENLSVNDQDVDSDIGTPTQKDKKTFDTTSKQPRTLSPTSSDYSKSSSNSIFSELPPKLSTCGWHSSIYELEHVSDELNSGNSDENTSSSSESIVKLRNSNKVKDKAALFEKLISNDYAMSGNQKKLKKKKSYGVLTSAGHNNMLSSLSNTFSSSKRNISKGYLEELERCNLIIAGIPTSRNELEDMVMSNHTSRLNRNEVVPSRSNETELRLQSNMGDREIRESSRLKSRKLQRSKLNAFVTGDNKICYEKL